MPIPISAALDETGALASAKARQVRAPHRYLIGAMLAGAYVGVAVVLLASVAGPLLSSASPVTKLVQAGVFGIALTLVVFAGANLFTGDVMFMLQGLARGTCTMVDLLAVWVVALVGNIVGSLGFAWIVHAAGTLASGGNAAKAGPGDALIKSLIAAKTSASDGQLFWRSLLCNMLVCLALWMAARTTSDVAKLVVLFWGLFAFVGSGFEHSVANMTIFSLAVFNHVASWGALVHNLALTIPGNIVGGGVVVGIAYAYLGRPERSARTVVATGPVSTTGSLRTNESAAA